MSSHLDLVDFRLFANIAEANSFTAGAEKSNLSTSAASLRIRHLEESLGGKLFHRTSHGSTLTPAGDACLARVRTILQEFEVLKEELSRHSQDEGPRLRIAVNSSGVNEPLPTVMREYMNRYPEVKLALDVKMSNEITPAVVESVADVGIGGFRSPGVTILPYLKDRLVLIMAPEHPLATVDNIRFAEALDHNIISLPEYSNTQIFMRRIASNSRKPMRSTVSVNSFEGLFQMVKAGVGLGVLSERVAAPHAAKGTVKLISLKDKSASSDIPICVSSLHELPDHAQKFVELLQKAARHDEERPESYGTTRPPSTGRVTPVI